MHSAPTILLTRPQEDSAILAEKLRRIGFHSLVCPMLEISHLPGAVAKIETSITPGSAILITSRHAATLLPDSNIPRHTRVFAVGDETAEIAEKAGFSNIYVAGGTVQSLIASVMQQVDITTTRCVYIAGKSTFMDVTGLLTQSGAKDAVTVEVYDAHPIESLPHPIVMALLNKHVNGVVFFSRRTTQHFMHLCRTQNVAPELKSMDAFCFSRPISLILDTSEWRSILPCHVPKTPVLIELIRKHYSKR